VLCGIDLGRDDFAAVIFLAKVQRQFGADKAERLDFFVLEEVDDLRGLDILLRLVLRGH